MQPSHVLTLRGPDDIINCIKCLDGNIITGSISGKLNLWNLNTKRLALSTQSHHQSILSLAQINNNCSNSLLSSSRDGDVKVWDIENLCNPSLSTFVTGAFHFCNISTDQDGLDKYCLITPSNNLSEVITWDLRASTKSLSFNIPDSCGMTTHLLYYSTSLVGSTVFVGSEDGSVSAFDLRNTR